MSKKSTVIYSMIVLAAAIVTGFILHDEVHHKFVYNNPLLWTLHEIIGMLMVIFVTVHCRQHSPWFRNYTKIKPQKKRVTTIFLIIGIIVGLTGIFLMCGSQSNFISLAHYITAIIFTIVAIRHVAHRWQLFRSLRK